jgi:hypothetical protein
MIGHTQVVFLCRQILNSAEFKQLMLYLVQEPQAQDESRLTTYVLPIHSAELWDNDDHLIVLQTLIGFLIS